MILCTMVLSSAAASSVRGIPTKKKKNGVIYNQPFSSLPSKKKKKKFKEIVREIGEIIKSRCCFLGRNLKAYGNGTSWVIN